MFQEFLPEDLPLLNRVLQLYPDITEVIKIVQLISPKVNYPIQNFEEIANALDSEEVTISFEDQSFNLIDIGQFLPDYYFPIGSEDDLIAKIADIRAQVFSSVQVEETETSTGLNLLRGEAQPNPPEGTEPPNIPMEEIRTIVEQHTSSAIGGLQ
ncbi:MAG: hypothetical protein IGS39_01890 [Calothrix sp. C42_A2020_038]|nr:hypothetical protein [Calothrix sp. C42_A2020_038]